jgi:hypothetical protein
MSFGVIQTKVNSWPISGCFRAFTCLAERERGNLEDQVKGTVLEMEDID